MIKTTRSRRVPIYPKSKIKLIKLWPHARKQGHEVGEVHEVGYYYKGCGPNIIWLTKVGDSKKLQWTIEEPFLKKYFVVIEKSKERKIY